MYRRMKILLSFYIIITISFILCSRQELSNELVMSPGMIIEANNKYGEIKIEAGKGLRRTYYWNDKKVSVKMRPRKQRWYGSLGLYHPGGGRNVHAVLDEGQQHFCSEMEVMDWLRLRENGDCVHTNDGLVVWWRQDKGPGPLILHVEVSQIYINGEKPKNLPDAQNNKIKIYFNRKDFPKTLIKAGKFIPSSPKKINDRWYSGRVLDLMKERGYTVAQVEKAIQYGKLSKEKNYKYTWDGGNAFNDFWIVWTDQEGRVIMVGP